MARYDQSPQWFDPEVERQRQLASGLRSQAFNPQQGRMVSGHYVSPGIGAAIAPIAQAFASKRIEGRADELQSQRQKQLSEALRTPPSIPEGIRDPNYKPPQLTERLSALENNPQAQQLAMQLRLREATREEQPRLQTMSGAAYGFPEGTTVQVNPQTGQVTPLYQPEAPDYNQAVILGPDGRPMANQAYIDAQSAIRAAGRDGGVNIDFGNMMGGAPELGKLSTDYGYILDPETGQPVIDPETGLPQSAVIPNSPAALELAEKEQAAARQRDAQTVSGAEKSDAVLSSITNIRDIIKSSDTPVTGTFSRPIAQFSSTPAGKVRSYIGTLKSGVALGALLRLKEASSTGASGFGALSAPELQLLIDDIGALDPATTDEGIILETLDRIENRYQRVAQDIAQNVDPQKIEQLGLTSIIQNYGGQQQSPDENQNNFEGFTIERVE